MVIEISRGWALPEKSPAADRGSPDASLTTGMANDTLASYPGPVSPHFASLDAGYGDRGGEAAMKLARRKFLHLAAGALALPAASRVACAQAYPARSIRLIIGYPPGGSADMT